MRVRGLGFKGPLRVRDPLKLETGWDSLYINLKDRGCWVSNFWASTVGFRSQGFKVSRLRVEGSRGSGVQGFRVQGLRV